MKIENRQKLLLIAAVAVVVVFFGDRLVFTPLSHFWSSRQQEIAKLRTQVTEGKLLQGRERALRNHWAEMQTNALPNSPSSAQEKVLKAFENWSQESGASLNAISPQWKDGDSDDYKTLVCRVDASGNLWALSRFLYDIEQSPFALKTETLTLNSADKTGSTINLGLQVSGLMLIPKGQ